MKSFFGIFSLFSFIFLFGCNQQNSDNQSNNDSINRIESFKKENLPEAFKELPVGIKVINEPDTIYAELNDRGGKKYIWKHTTTIKALNKDLQIIEFGSYNYKQGGWHLGNKTQKPYTTEDFDKWYCRKKNGIITFDYCTDGNILKDVEYIDPSNYCITNDSLVNRHGLWYYIGIDSIGNKFMGFGSYITVNKLKDK
jgi:hypothetical protein